MLNPPVISLPDPLLADEGGIDPLSLQRTYERLADRMLPAVTVRMTRIRFLSVMCVGAHVCSTFEPDLVASDEITPPWLVFEWFVVEALARTDTDKELRTIAGLQKVRRCLDAQRPVSATTYLKTPKVFGFSGIFRRLATGATILDDDMSLDDGGWELLRAFEKDEALTGLLDGGSGDGARLVRDMRDAVKVGLERGHTVARTNDFYQRVAEHLVPTRSRKRERAVLLARLRGSQALSSEIVDDLAQRDARVARDDEASYLRSLASRVSPELQRLLRAIDAYEALCRPIVDAFALIRHLSTIASGAAVGRNDFAKHARSADLVNATREGCRRVAADAALLDLEPDVRIVLEAFEDARTAQALFDAVIAHHEQAQRGKPPDGKRPWLEPGNAGTVLVRPRYQVPELDDAPLPYVHDYRIGTVSRFLADLGVFA